jgi:NodT family efflux transporter outer membrane factor (OMF) lipoprotein
VRPDSPDTQSYTSEKPHINGQNLQIGKEIPAQWWMLFRSPQLGKLIEQALKHSPDLQAAQNALTEASELAIAKNSGLFPSVDASFMSKRQQISGAQFGNPNMTGSQFNIFSPSINVSYTLDVFGAVQRTIEGLMAEADYQRFQLEGAFLTLSGNIVTTAITEAAIREQIGIIEDLIKLRTQQLDIVKQQQALGGATQADVLAQQTAVEQERANLPALQKQLQQTRHRLAVLVGNTPNQEPPIFTMADLKLPKDLPLSLPSKLVTQRPDIRGQEALLKAANAKIGFMLSKMFPDFTITASVASIATRVGDLFIPGSAIWNTGLNLLQPIFHGGENVHQYRAAAAAYEAAAARYRSTVLNALQNVADTLSALEADSNAINAQTTVLQTAQTSLELNRTQYKVGAVSYLSTLNAENAYQQARIGLIKAKASQLANTVALFQALGGGWWQRADLARELGTQQSKKEPAWLPYFDWSFK